MAREKETAFNKAEKKYKEISAIKINASTGRYTVDGKSLTSAEYRKVLVDAKRERDVAKKLFDEEKSKRTTETKRASGEQKKNQKQLDDLKKERQTLANEIKNYSEDIRRGSTADISGKNISLERKQELIDQRALRIREIDIALGVLEPDAPRSPTSADAPATPTRGPLQGPIQGPFLAGAGEEGMRATAELLTQRTTTGRTRGTGQSAGKTKRERKPKAMVNWEETFRRMFPTQAWLLDIDKSKFPGLNQLLQRAATDRMWESQEGLQRFAAELEATDFYVDLRDKDTVRTVKSLVGDLGFESKPFNKFLTDAANFGWEGDTLKSEVYKEAFRKDDVGNYVNPTAVARAKKSTDWLKVSGIGKSFFNNLSDNAIEQRLTGVTTDEDIVRQQRELAKTKYGHLSNLIDQGLTLEEIAASYRDRAASLLERDVNDIDMGTTDFEVAFNYGDEGKKRLMSTGEWEIMLRSDAKYGWDKTQNAKQEARGLATSIAQAFGRII